PIGESLAGQLGAAGLVVGATGLVDRVVKQDRQRDLGRLPPAGTGRDLLEHVRERVDVGDAVIAAMRLAVALAQLGDEVRLAAERVQQRSPAHSNAARSSFRVPRCMLANATFIIGSASGQASGEVKVNW